MRTASGPPVDAPIASTEYAEPESGGTGTDGRTAAAVRGERMQRAERRGANFIDDRLAELAARLQRRRFAQHVDRSQFQGVQCGVAARGRLRADHDHGQRVIAHQLAQKRQPVDARHFQV